MSGQDRSAASSGRKKWSEVRKSPAAQTCPACRPAFDGQGAPDMCTQGDGCIIEEAFGPTDSEKRRQDARSVASPSPRPYFEDDFVKLYLGDALLALQELGHADVAERLRARWGDVEASERYARPP